MYDREAAVAYAHEWAFKRNPRYLNFAGIGGDCTNFISQCLLAGGAPMNYEKTFGWYYTNASNRAPAWTSVQYLYNFLVRDTSIGPKGKEVGITQLEKGDVVQLSFDGLAFHHSLLVVHTGVKKDLAQLLLATHSLDADDRPLSSYQYVKARFVKIYVPD
ncbi:MAG: amidase domain-containing protein [Clostridiales bacterium]|nr:amidase domain-containing protein [Clostridiales bacterium]